MTTQRTSPLAHSLATLHPEWVSVSGMPLAAVLHGDAPGRSATLGVCDLSALSRVGVKGPGAAQWLAARGVPVPDQPNTWRAIDGGGLVARLARTEFLVEDGFEGSTTVRLTPELRPGATPGVYPVPRQDCALALTGAQVNELLVQTCNVDFSAQDPAARIVTLTQMVGVSITALHQSLGGTVCWRLWCDGTSGPYLWATLAGIAGELGGGPTGFRSAFPDVKL
jgi:sarcosine oxidase subunit gamma